MSPLTQGLNYRSACDKIYDPEEHHFSRRITGLVHYVIKTDVINICAPVSYAAIEAFR